MAPWLITFGVGYLLGSIPFGYLLVLILHKEDIRNSGSGNIGATNVSRKSPWLGLLTLLLDAGKGMAAVMITVRLFPSPVWMAGLAAFAAIVGHSFSIWLKFRGGKGVATGLGSFLPIAPKTILVLILIFLAIVAISRYVALASVLSVALFPAIGWVIEPYRDTPLMLTFMAASSILIIVRHQGNIRRLMAGTEPRLYGRQQ
jgi:acyl phosphate:glycerol-3-phosphate acyltransferase